MKYLLEVFLKYFDFLYLDPRYHITNSSTSGAPDIDAQILLTGDILSWSFTNDRGQVILAVAPTAQLSPENWFRLSIIRRHLDKTSESGSTLTVEAIDWLRANASRVESLFLDARVSKMSCEALIALENAVADELFGPSK
jgi:hypothetical protein